MTFSPAAQYRTIEKWNGHDHQLLQKTKVNDLAAMAAFWQQEISSWTNPQTVIWLDGDLGAGKTTSVHQMMRFLNPDLKDVSSPTFALHHQYSIKHFVFNRIDHVDLYRIQGEGELEQTGFWDLFEKSGSLVLIEWGMRLRPEQMPLEWEFFRYMLSEQRQ